MWALSSACSGSERGHVSAVSELTDYESVHCYRNSTAGVSSIYGPYMPHVSAEWLICLMTATRDACRMANPCAAPLGPRCDKHGP
jgi:hypothetical protein